MNAYEISLTITGNEATKLAVLRTLSRSNIPVGTVAMWLREKGLWLRTSPTSMSGILQSIIDNHGTSQQLKDGLGLLWSSVFGEGAHELRTSEVAWAPTVYGIVSAIALAVPDIAGLVDQFYALGGGRPFPNIDSAGLAIEKNLYEVQQEAKAIASAKQLLTESWHQFSQTVLSKIADGSLTDKVAIRAHVESSYQ